MSRRPAAGAARRRPEQTDLVVVVQRAHRDPSEAGELADGVVGRGSRHGPTVRPLAAQVQAVKEPSARHHGSTEGGAPVSRNERKETVAGRRRGGTSARSAILGPNDAQPFAHLHVHSEYSLLDGACKINDLVKRAAAFDQPASVSPITGDDAPWSCSRRQEGGDQADRRLRDHLVGDLNAEKKQKRTHLTLMAQNNEGYKNLVRLSSAGFLQGMSSGSPPSTWRCSSSTTPTA